MWTEPNLGSGNAANRKWYSGDSIPCSSFNSLVEDSDFQCIMQAGDTTGLTRSIKVHVVGFHVAASTAVNIMLFDIQLPTGSYAAERKFRVYLHTFKGDSGNNNKAPYTFQATSYCPYFMSTDPATGVTWTESAGTDLTLSGLNYFSGTISFTTPADLTTSYW